MTVGPSPEELASHFRRLAVAALVPQLHAAEKVYAEKAATDTEALLETQRVLSERRAALSAAVASLKQVRGRARQCVKGAVVVAASFQCPP